jgi:hypothetical protein
VYRGTSTIDFRLPRFDAVAVQAGNDIYAQDKE